MKNNYIYLLSALLISFTISAQSIDSYNVSDEVSVEIENRVSEMSESEAQTRKAQLETQAAELEEEKSSTQNPSRLKEITDRISEMNEELKLQDPAMSGEIDAVHHLTDKDLKTI